MWGIRLFEDAKPAAERRVQRNNRRRLDRKKWRSDLLQELFAPEIQDVDKTFFIRMNESPCLGFNTINFRSLEINILNEFSMVAGFFIF